jgi:uncharacterized protein YecE (DUF72 family)
MTPTIHVGCCGLQMARKAYFQFFRLTEVQQTFYQPPQPSTLAKWRAEAPPDFEFTLKAWQAITHPVGSPTWRGFTKGLTDEERSAAGFFRPNETVLTAWEATPEIAAALAARGFVLQCPPSFAATNLPTSRATPPTIFPSGVRVTSCGFPPFVATRNFPSVRFRC